MNIKVATIENWTNNGDGTYSSSRINVQSSNGRYTGKHVTKGSTMYCYNTSTSTGTATAFAAYKITDFAKALAGRITTVTLTRLNSNIDSSGEQIDDDVPVTGFICSNENNIDDIPYGQSLEIPGDLTEEARTYNLRQSVQSVDPELENRITKLENKKLYFQKIDLNDIAVNETGDDKKKYAARLDYFPLSDVTLEINGVAYNEYDDNDFEVERNSETNTATVYFDTIEDDFSFEDLKNMSTAIVLKYQAIVA